MQRLADDGGRETVLARVWRPFKVVLFSNLLNVLLLFFPLAIWQWKAGSDSLAFVFSLVSLLSLAERVSFLVEQMEHHTGPTVALLLNVCIGSIPELIQAILYMIYGYVRLVQVSLIGSIFGNLLFVQGFSYTIAGFRHVGAETLKFANKGSGLATALLILYASGVFLVNEICDDLGVSSNLEATLEQLEGSLNVTVVDTEPGDSYPEWGPEDVSRVFAVLSVLSYVAFLIFQLYTHNELFDFDEDEEAEAAPAAYPTKGAAEAKGKGGIPAAKEGEEGPVKGEAWTCPPILSPDYPDGKAPLTFLDCLVALVLVAAAISFVSEAMVDTIEAAALSYGISTIFLAGIVAPIMGNAAEHALASVLAYKGDIHGCNMITIGSAVQIGLFIFPVMILVSWAMYGEATATPLTYGVGDVEFVITIMSVIMVAFVIASGQANYMQGIVMMCLYFTFATAYFVSDESITMDLVR
jgi:Ca2+:H+ antiporter